MRETYSSRLLSLLEKRIGKTVAREELHHILEKNKKPARFKEKLKKKRPNNKADLLMISLLDSLVKLGVLLPEGKGFRVLSAGEVQGIFQPIRRGGGFVRVDRMVGTPMDMEVFVPEHSAVGVIVKDKVAVRLTDFRRRGWDGEITKVIRPAANEFMAIYERNISLQIPSKERGRKGFDDRAKTKQKPLHQLRLLDQPGLHNVLLSGEHFFQSGDPLLIHLARDNQGFLSEGARDLPIAGLFAKLDRDDPQLDFIRVAVKHQLPRQWPETQALQRLILLSKKMKNELELIHYLDAHSPWPDLKRKDLRSLFTITMDGVDAKDFDDALSYEIRENTQVLYVHIADLALWVEAGTDLDKEACERGNSTYLQHKVIPMLPPFLSEEHCSLRAGEPKAAFTCELHYNASFKCIATHFYPSLIEVNHRLTYTQGEQLLQDKEPLDTAQREESITIIKKMKNFLHNYNFNRKNSPKKNPLDPQNANFSHLHQIPSFKESKELKEFMHGLKRITDGLRRSSAGDKRLDIQLPELAIERLFGKKTIGIDPIRNKAVDGHDTNVAQVEIVLKSPLSTYNMVEEAMLAANRAAAALLKEKGKGALFRVHEKPDYEKIYALQLEMAFYGVKWQVDVENPQDSLIDLVERTRTHPLAFLLHYLVLRSMKQAQYANEPEVGHFGLGFQDYLHFTSPIRRYPDLVVHRQLRNLLAGKKEFYSTDELAGLGRHCSTTERKSVDAERDMLRLALCRFFYGREGEFFPAMITGASRDGFYITLINPPVEGRLLWVNLQGDFFRYHEESKTAYGQRTGMQINLGMKIEARLEKVSWEDSTVDFAIHVNQLKNTDSSQTLKKPNQRSKNR